MENGMRGDLLDRPAEAIESAMTAHPLRIAIDGPPAGHSAIDAGSTRNPTALIGTRVTHDP
jgi:hypothetical protein